ncbi:MAG: T9SS type A sorting domain-containing protein, partial [Chitinophagaceae bacterium]|nr:T9SS type A sorting domain-containing protein [Chitinophagaceae bacterium]
MQKTFYTLVLLTSLVLFGNISKAQYVFEILPFHAVTKGPLPENIVAIDTFLYCAAGNDTSGFEPWISDGTLAGSRMIKDIYPGNNSAHAGNFTSYNGKVYFSSNDGTNGYELWVTDGTTNGTNMVKDINPGVLYSYPNELVAFKGKLLFWADDGTNGRELWETDGTTNGTQLLKDVTPGSAGTKASNSRPLNYTELNGKMYFLINYELWETDGTTNGTHVATITSAGFGGLELITLFNNKIYLTTKNGNSFWETDGTVNGTKKVKDIGARSDIVVLNNKMYFAGRENSSIGVELYVSDGTTNGTQLVKDIYPSNYKSSDPSSLTVSGNQLFFVANDSIHGKELWVTDGTTNGTKLVKDIFFLPGMPTGGAGINNLTAFDSSIFFSANDTFPSTREDLWVSDGTATGTKKLLDQGSNKFYEVNHNEVPFLVCNNNMYFRAITDSFPWSGNIVTEYALWKMTDTSKKTQPPTNITKTKTTNNITIAPNPAHDKVTIGFDKAYNNAQLSIVDITGKMILNKPIDATQKVVEVSLPEVSTGVYILNIHHDEG